MVSPQLAGLFCSSPRGWRSALGMLASSYFNESDLELTADHLRHIDEESGLVGIVFDNDVVHVDVNSAGGGEREQTSVGGCARSQARGHASV